MSNPDEPRHREAEYDRKTLLETIQRLKKDNEALIHKIWKFKRKPTGKIAYLVLQIGALALVVSFFYESQIPAFIGIALIFWGALLLFVRPVNYMKTEILSSTVLPTFESINKIIENLDYKGKGIHLPSKHLKGANSPKLFIPFENSVAVPSENSTCKEVFCNNPQGMYLNPSGLELTYLFEDELGVDFAEANMDYLLKNFPKLFIEGLEIAKNFDMAKRSNKIRVRIWDSIYKDICIEARKLSKKVCSTFPCPLCSSIACAIAQVTGKPVSIEKSRISSDGEKMEVRYQTIEE
jgi:hypothetical protein